MKENLRQIFFYRDLDDEIPEEDLETHNLCIPGKFDVSSNLDLDEWVPSLGLSENFEGMKKVVMLKLC